MESLFLICPPRFKSFSGWADWAAPSVLIYSLAAFDGLSSCGCCLPPTLTGLVKTSFLCVSLPSPHSVRWEEEVHVCPVPLSNILQRSSSTAHKCHSKRLFLERCRASASIWVGEPGLFCGHCPRAGSRESTGYRARLPAGSSRVRWPPCPSSPPHPGARP